MCFLGGSGRSVKIVCRGELFEGGLPKGEKDIRQFHLNLYNTARQAYQNQFGFDIQFLEPRLDRTVYMSADPEMGYNADAHPFYADTNEHTLPQPVTISRDEDHLMPGRTVTRTYHLNWTFIVETIMGRYFDLTDENKEAELLMQIAARCLDEGIPQAHAKGLTMLHPVLNRDKMLVEKIFHTVYSVTEQEDYREKHKIKPLKSVPEDTIQASPKETEQGKWWSLGDISQLLANRYANFDPETPFQKIGNALNDVQFNFKSKRKTNHMEYWLIEK